MSSFINWTQLSFFGSLHLHFVFFSLCILIFIEYTVKINSMNRLLIYVSYNSFWYPNDTGTNLYKQELFVMAIMTPTGRTFPGNFTIVPSAKKWVFHAIFWHAFLSLYGECICSLNRLVLTDEEDADYRSFECVIETHNVFQFSRVMLCTFHAIWQPFKRDLYPLLP